MADTITNETAVADDVILRVLRMRDGSWIHDSASTIQHETAQDLQVSPARVRELWPRKGEVDFDAAVPPVPDSVIAHLLGRFTRRYNRSETERALGAFAFELGMPVERVQSIFALQTA